MARIPDPVFIVADTEYYAHIQFSLYRYEEDDEKAIAMLRGGGIYPTEGEARAKAEALLAAGCSPEYEPKVWRIEYAVTELSV
jgi:hypothetical protein